MSKDHKEWILQAEYDMETADIMFDAGRYFYAVFMCHLAIEKALKGIFLLKLGVIPPKTHNLVYLINKIDVKPDKNIIKIIAKLNEANVVTRYPENIKDLQKDYTKEIVENIIKRSKEVLEWIKTLQ
ncbi:MAG: HEPN domain-containing protein [Candidatus Poribacteria bacterium]